MSWLWLCRAWNTFFQKGVVLVFKWTLIATDNRRRQTQIWPQVSDTFPISIASVSLTTSAQVHWKIVVCPGSDFSEGAVESGGLDVKADAEYERLALFPTEVGHHERRRRRDHFRYGNISCVERRLPAFYLAETSPTWKQRRKNDMLRGVGAHVLKLS